MTCLGSGCRSALSRRSAGAAQSPLGEPQGKRWSRSVLRSAAVNVDETGWVTAGNNRTLWTATTPEAAIFRIAAGPPPRPAPRTPRRAVRRHLLLRPLVGLQPDRPRKPPGLLEPPPARLPLPRRRAPDPKAVRRARPLSPPAASSTPGTATTNTKTAPGSPTRSRPIQTDLRALVEEAGRKTLRNNYHRGFANNLLKIWPALWTFVTQEGVEPTNNAAERSLRGPVIHRKLSHGTRSRRRRTLHRTRPLSLRHLPPTKTIALRLPHRPAHRPRPRRPAPHPHLNQGTERLQFRPEKPVHD